MTSFRMHHAVDTLAINDESDSNTSANCNVAKRLPDWMATHFGFAELEEGADVNVSINKDAFFSVIKQERSFKQLVNGEVLPCEFGRRRDAAVLT